MDGQDGSGWADSGNTCFERFYVWFSVFVQVTTNKAEVLGLLEVVYAEKICC